MHSEVHIVISIFLSMENEHIIQAIVGDAILLNDILEGNEVGDRLLVKTDMWLATGYL